MLNRQNALVMRQSPRWLQFFAGFMVTIGGGFLATAYFVRIDEVVTATGQLRSNLGTAEVKTPAGGKVERLLVSNGQNVEEGQLLLVFDTTLAEERAESAKKLLVLERRGLEKKLTSLDVQQKTLERRLETQDKILKEYSTLVENGGYSALQYLRERDRAFEIRSQLDILDEQKQQASIEADKTIRRLEGQLEEAELQLRYQNVLAPTSGIVFDVQAQASGVIGAGETILSLVPTTGLVAEVFVPNKDIGFVKVGQNAKVRVDAFPSSRYGEINGSVSLIGADALEPDQTANYYRFPVKINLEQSFLETKGIEIPLRTGMSVTSNLQIRNKRAITLISDFFSGQLESIKALRQ